MSLFALAPVPSAPSGGGAGSALGAEARSLQQEHSRACAALTTAESKEDYYAKTAHILFHYFSRKENAPSTDAPDEGASPEESVHGGGRGARGAKGARGALKGGAAGDASADGCRPTRAATGGTAGARRKMQAASVGKKSVLDLILQDTPVAGSGGRRPDLDANTTAGPTADPTADPTACGSLPDSERTQDGQGARDARDDRDDRDDRDGRDGRDGQDYRDGQDWQAAHESNDPYDDAVLWGGASTAPTGWAESLPTESWLDRRVAGDAWAEGAEMSGICGRQVAGTSGPRSAPAPTQAEESGGGGAPPSQPPKRRDFSVMNRVELLECFTAALTTGVPRGADGPLPEVAPPVAQLSASEARQAERASAQDAAVGANVPCFHCGSLSRFIVANEGFLHCPECDTVEHIVIESERPSYRDPPREISYFCYKRQNHFQEWISQTQGREYTNIPETVYAQILTELKKQKVVNLATLTAKKLKDVMRKLTLNKYYEHIPHILQHLSGAPAVRISPELEAQLRRMFALVQVPFRRHSNRRNFLSYSVVLHKFIQLLGHDELLPYFPLLKSREKLHAQEVIWKVICKDLNWQFIPSI